MPLCKRHGRRDCWMDKIEHVIARNGRYIASPQGISMRPMLRQGRDTVLLVPPERTLVRGDVILYRRPSGKLVLHRIVRVKKNGYLLGADNLAHREKGVQSDWIIGVMRGFYRDEKYIDATAFGYRAYWHLMLYTHLLRAPFMALRERRMRKGKGA